MNIQNPEENTEQFTNKHSKRTIIIIRTVNIEFNPIYIGQILFKKGAKKYEI